MTQPKAASKFTSGALRAYERNTDPLNWAIRDADNHMVAEHIPKQLALLFIKAPEMYELLDSMTTLSRELFGAIVDEARRIKAAIDGD